MLMPSVNLLDSLDNLLREYFDVEIPARRIYLAKQGFRAGELRRGVNYFNKAKLRAQMGVFHFLDLAHLGAAKCDDRHLSNVLTEFLNRVSGQGEQGVMVGHSEDDSMTTWNSVSKLCAGLNLRDGALQRVALEHNLETGVRYFRSPADDQSKKPSDSGMRQITHWLVRLGSQLNSTEIGETR